MSEPDAIDGPQCSDDPEAPHGFDRDLSHTLNRYVCECEGWEMEKALEAIRLRRTENAHKEPT